MNGFTLVYRNSGNDALFTDSLAIVNRTIKGNHSIHIQGSHIWNLTNEQLVLLQNRITRYYRDFSIVCDKEQTERDIEALVKEALRDLDYDNPSDVDIQEYLRNCWQCNLTTQEISIIRAQIKRNGPMKNLQESLDALHLLRELYPQKWVYLFQYEDIESKLPSEAWVSLNYGRGSYDIPYLLIFHNSEEVRFFYREFPCVVG